MYFFFGCSFRLFRSRRGDYFTSTLAVTASAAVVTHTMQAFTQVGVAATSNAISGGKCFFAVTTSVCHLVAKGSHSFLFHNVLPTPTLPFRIFEMPFGKSVFALRASDRFTISSDKADAELTFLTFRNIRRVPTSDFVFITSDAFFIMSEVFFRKSEPVFRKSREFSPKYGAKITEKGEETPSFLPCYANIQHFFAKSKKC